MQNKKIENAMYQPVSERLAFAIDSTLSPTSTFEMILERWSFIVRTKFPLATQSSDLEKLNDELDELKKSIVSETRDEQILEYVDCIMCLIASFTHAGITVDEIKKAMRIKAEINANREWIHNGNGTYSHVKK